MTTYKTITFAIIIMLLNSCIAVPKVADNQEPRCELITKELTLETIKAEGFKPSGGSEGAAYVLLAIGAVYSATVIVSGSIMLTGNAVHWIEQEGTCDDGVIKEAINDMSNSLASFSGWFVDSAQDILDWLGIEKEEGEQKPL
jgi:hypothetical protein